jgi:hypothetical protein
MSTTVIWLDISVQRTVLARITVLEPAVVTRWLATGCPPRRSGASPRVVQCSGWSGPGTGILLAVKFLTFHEVHHPSINAAVYTDVAPEHLAAVWRCPHVGHLASVPTFCLLTYFIYVPRRSSLYRYGTRAVNEPIGGAWTLDECIWSTGMCGSGKEKTRLRDKRVPI